MATPSTTKGKGIGSMFDSLFKTIFTVIPNAIDFLCVVLPSGILKHLDFSTLKYDPTEYVDDNLKKYFTDVTFNIKYKNRPIKLTFILEHKSIYDENVKYQLLRYIANVWEQQNKNMGEPTPVIPIIFYHGEQAWQEPSFPKNIPDEFKTWNPAFEVLLYNTHAVENAEILNQFKKSDVKVGVWLLKARNKLWETLVRQPEVSNRFKEEMTKLPERAMRKIILYLNRITKSEPIKFNNIMDTLVLEDCGTIEEIEEVLREEGREEGLEEGLEKGRKETAIRMIKGGEYTNHQIEVVTLLSLSDIQKLRKQVE